MHEGEHVILSDRSLREEIAAGRIIIEPLDDTCVQPSSIDVKVGNLFRVFRNHTTGIIDVMAYGTSFSIRCFKSKPFAETIRSAIAAAAPGSALR